MYRRILKRGIDFLVALLALIVLSPIYLGVIIGLAWANSGRVFFHQIRPGKDEKLFSILKFKTMNDQRDAAGNLLPDAVRLTPMGALVRKASLDEIPQLINVLKGEMSLIGPRPLLPEYLPLYNQEQKRRHSVRPGITGWAQVNGRNSISWQQKFDMDVWYVDHLSFRLDLKILVLTLVKVWKREGISQEGQATIVAFKGNNEN